eukprot:1157471-Pelagomonas_calceolata.AAC.5
MAPFRCCATRSALGGSSAGKGSEGRACGAAGLHCRRSSSSELCFCVPLLRVKWARSSSTRARSSGVPASGDQQLIALAASSATRLAGADEPPHLPLSSYDLIRILMLACTHASQT